MKFSREQNEVQFAVPRPTVQKFFLTVTQAGRQVHTQGVSENNI